jgi:hypothetical protein
VLRGRPREGAGGDSGASRELCEAAVATPGAVGSISRAIAELARADFRIDPASPVPLEVACATAILGPAVAAPPVEAVAGGAGRSAPAGRAAPGRRANGPAPSPGSGQRDTSREDRLLAELRSSCSMVNFKLAAYLNGSCEVLSFEGNTIEIGFYENYRLSMEKIEKEGRELVEEQASAILGRPMQLAVKLIERSQRAKPAPKGGHLVQAAEALGAVRVGKEE